jgi:Tfp pilus assembly protein PilF
MPKAKAAAVRALEIDDSLAEAHAALGLYLSNFSWNQTAAEREFRRAIELNQNYPTAHHQFGSSSLVAMGRFDESIAEGRRAEELDPLSPVIGTDQGMNLLRARRVNEAIAQFNRTLTFDPNFYYARRALIGTLAKCESDRARPATTKSSVRLDQLRWKFFAGFTTHRKQIWCSHVAAISHQSFTGFSERLVKAREFHTVGARAMA